MQRKIDGTSRAFHWKTRIETLSWWSSRARMKKLPDHSIEKLGLKHNFSTEELKSYLCSRPFHWKTRIETLASEVSQNGVQKVPDHSIEKLGLKHQVGHFLLLFIVVPDHSIEKLGLKHWWLDFFVLTIPCSRPFHWKTRIETKVLRSYYLNNFLFQTIPLKN